MVEAQPEVGHQNVSFLAAAVNVSTGGRQIKSLTILLNEKFCIYIQDKNINCFPQSAYILISGIIPCEKSSGI